MTCRLTTGDLPSALTAYHDKLYGLSIDPSRLSEIRGERLAKSRYASLEQCRWELIRAERLYRRLGIPFLNTTRMSVEEIASVIRHARPGRI